MLFYKTTDDAAEIASLRIVTLYSSGMRYTGETETVMKDGKAEAWQYSMSNTEKARLKWGHHSPKTSKTGGANGSHSAFGKQRMEPQK